MDSGAQTIENGERDKALVTCSTFLRSKSPLSPASLVNYLVGKLHRSLTCPSNFHKKTWTSKKAFLHCAAAIFYRKNKYDRGERNHSLDNFSFCEAVLNSVSCYSKANVTRCGSSFEAISTSLDVPARSVGDLIAMDVVSCEDFSARHSVDGGSSTVSVDVTGDGSTSETLSFRADDILGSSAGSSPLAWPTRKPEPATSQAAPIPSLVTSGEECIVSEGIKKDEANLSEAKKKQNKELSEVEMMKERFSKLLLGEDMSGGGKGVCTALAISNAITNLSATVFGELWRLEPLAIEKKTMWKREMDWLLAVSEYIVELIPAIQHFPNGSTLEIMVSRPRSDIHINLPALRKLDAMLLDILESFTDTEFWYVDQGILLPDADGSAPVERLPQRQEEKWWLPIPRVPSGGLSDYARKRLHHQRECTNQILKAAMSINNNVLSEIEVPDVYLEALPKNGRASLGDIIYRYITAEQFSPDCLLDCLDLSSEHHTLEIANRVEAAIYVWRRKTTGKHCNGKENRPNMRSSWGIVKDLIGDADKRELLADRAESLLLSLKHRFPGLSQTVLDTSKIQYNKDVGQSILESYSRVLESLAFNILARIDDLLYVDDLSKHCESHQHSPIPPLVSNRGSSAPKASTKFLVPAASSTPYVTAFTTPKSSATPTLSPCKSDRTSLANNKSNSQQSTPVKVLSNYLGGESKHAGDPRDSNMENMSVLNNMGKYRPYPENLECRKASV